MNEQLIVKNFGPIKDATVDFKRVTVFIGPTGGGKSTLAKLAAVFRDDDFFFQANEEERTRQVIDDLALYGIQNFGQMDTDVQWRSTWLNGGFGGETGGVHFSSDSRSIFEEDALVKLETLFSTSGIIIKNIFSPQAAFQAAMASAGAGNRFWEIATKYFPFPKYIPADRTLAVFVANSTFRLQNQKAGVSSILIDFLADFETARDSLVKNSSLAVPFLNARYSNINGQYVIEINNDITPLTESASGFQAVVPLLTVIAFDSQRYNNSFIVEEPELNLYPTAQQGLLNWLVEKCTKGENDLTLTTHSPYILSHLNLLLYAYQVARDHPDRADEVAEIVPRASWINPKEFACYQVENGGVTSLVSEDLGLIDDNGLDNLSGDAADAFDNLIRLSKAAARK